MALDKMIVEAEGKSHAIIDKIVLDPKEAMGLLHEVITLKLVSKISIHEAGVDVTTKELMWTSGIDKSEHIKAIIQKWYKTKYEVTYSDYPLIVAQPVLDVPNPRKEVNPWMGESHLDKPRPPAPPSPPPPRPVTGMATPDDMPITKQMIDAQPPPRPKGPPNRILRDDLSVDKHCKKCGSSIKTKWIFFKGDGCIQPECEDYWKNK